MKFSTSLNKHVPKELRANLRWRAAVHRRVLRNPDYADLLWDACSKDPLFYINGFCWTYDPRVQPFPKVPFILYEFQENALTSIIDSIGNRDILIEKSRDMGASWLCVSAYQWAWQFKKDLSFLFISRKENYVDEPGNPKALFWKFDYLLENQPVWLQPRGYNTNVHSRTMHRENPETGSVADGESTNQDAGRGDRRTGVVLDEFSSVEEKGDAVLAATRDTTKSRAFNSTPRGAFGAFYKMRQTSIVKIRMHWTQHPVKAEGLYRKDDGKYVAIDQKYWSKNACPVAEMERLDKMIVNKGVPLPDEKLRSPWYANECDRAASAQEIAQEVDIDYAGAGFQYFNSELVAIAIEKFARPAMLTGDLDYDAQTADPIRFREDPNGKLRLWCLLDGAGNPVILGDIVQGHDISAGTGASNSAASGWRRSTREKLYEYVNPLIRPEEFAKYSVALAKWFGNAKMIWEANGPGRNFGSRVIELKYGNFYLRQRDESLKKTVSDIPGVASTTEVKGVFMGEYREAVEKFRCVNYSEDSLKEALEYIYAPDGRGVVHCKSMDKSDPSGARDNHGDRVIADALAWKLIGGIGKPKVSASNPTMQPGCLAWRMEQRRLREEKLKPSKW